MKKGDVAMGTVGVRAGVVEARAEHGHAGAQVELCHVRRGRVRLGLRAGVAALVCVIGACGSASAQCEGWLLEGPAGWWFGPGPEGGPNRVTGMRIFDLDGDGPGVPALIAAGLLARGDDDLLVNGVAAWDGRAWHSMSAGVEALGSGSVGVSWFCEHDFDGAGPEPARLVLVGDRLVFEPRATSGRNVGWWDGARWRALHSSEAAWLPGTGVLYQVASYDADGAGEGLPRLVVCGFFEETIDGAELNNIAQWDGTAWRPLGSGLNNVVQTVMTHDPDGDGPMTPVLIAGGGFTTAGGQPALGVARWDGMQWTAMGDGLNGVFALMEFDADGSGPGLPVLMAGGSFGVPGGSPYVARWNGTAWEALSGTALGRNVLGLAAHDADGDGPALPVLIAGTGGQGSLSRVYRYGSSGWEVIGDAMDWVDSVASFDPDADGPELPRVVVSGNVRRMSSAAGEFNCGTMATWDGVDWKPLGARLLPTSTTVSGAFAATVYDADGEGPGAAALVVGGRLDTAGTGVANHLAMWTREGGWGPLGLGVGVATSTSTRVNALTVFDEDGDGPGLARLIAGGSFSTAGGAGAQNVAAWDGSAWTNMPGLGSAVTDVFVYEEAPGGSPWLVAVSNSLVYRWTGSGWVRLGTGTSTLGTVSELGSFPVTGAGDELIAATGNGVFRWNGTAWVQIGSLGGRPALSLASYEVDGVRRLVVGASSGGSVKGLMYWNGTGWAVLGGAGVDGSVTAIAVTEARVGSPAKLMALGSGSLSAPGVALSRLVSWDGTAWRDEAFGFEVTGSVSEMLVERVTAPESEAETVVVVGDRLKTAHPFWSYGHITPVLRRMAELPPFVYEQPRIQRARVGQTAAFKVGVQTEVGIGPSYQWMRGEEMLVDGVTATGSVIAGAMTSRLEIANVRGADAGEYRCVVTNGCAAVESMAAGLSVECPVDLNGDGVVDFGDYLEFLNLFDAGDERVDFNADGVVDFGDYLEFLNLYEAGC